jgi:hypothetical protein
MDISEEEYLGRVLVKLRPELKNVDVGLRRK